MKGYTDQLIRTTKIHDAIVSASLLFDEPTKQALHQHAAFVRDFLAKNTNASSYQLKSLATSILTGWNESINPDTEAFWTAMDKSHIAFKRKEPLRFALAKGWFRHVEQGIQARNYWHLLKQLPSVFNTYSKTERERIDEIIKEDEKKRLHVLKKCLAKNAIPQTQYLKFGECMAYFSRCHLFEVYFTSEQVDDLFTIWKNFKAN